MAKQTATPAKKATKKVAKESEPLIVKAAKGILEKLSKANIDPQLQSDIQWCLGSYSHDKNPIGLYEVAEKAIKVFKAEHAKKTKGFTAKAITDIEKALKEK
ncbi:MAG: hypothetical protein QM734_06670 [Cyclobacteriaceae bacterium]